MLVPVLVLLVLEPHMSGILLTTAIVGTILLLGGSGGIITWGCAGAALFLLETLLKHVDSIDYLQSRLDGWTQDLDRMTSQTKQSLYAIGSGGATGLGLGNSRQNTSMCRNRRTTLSFRFCVKTWLCGRGSDGGAVPAAVFARHVHCSARAG